MRLTRKKRVSLLALVLVITSLFTSISLLSLTYVKPSSLDETASSHSHLQLTTSTISGSENGNGNNNSPPLAAKGSAPNIAKSKSCASVEEMGEPFKKKGWREESLRVRKLIKLHFHINGASRVRNLPPEEFCKQGFVLGKSSEAGFGNEMYKILTGAALSVMLNRSLIIGQTRERYPFGEYIAYSNVTFTLKEVKHLWRQNGCLKKYGRHLVIRVDDFEKPSQTHVLCGNWLKWKQPIIWFQGTTDAVGGQFFLKNIHRAMRKTASNLFGLPESLSSRPNVFGELMKILIYPSKDVEEAVNWVLAHGADPDMALHMRMLMNRSPRALQAALNCVRNAARKLQKMAEPRVVLVSDTPSIVKSLSRNISEFAEVLSFDYGDFKGHVSQKNNKLKSLEFRVKDWGPAPRWVAFVDFFLASRAKHAVVSGAHKRVGTTYAQLIAALAAANSLEENSTRKDFLFLSSFQSNLLADGLRMQVGWGHVWNRFAGPLSCHKQPNQCAYSPLLPPAWWDGVWQSPIYRDIRRLAAYGIFLSDLGKIDETELQYFCRTRKRTVHNIFVI